MVIRWLVILCHQHDQVGKLEKGLRQLFVQTASGQEWSSCVSECTAESIHIPVFNLVHAFTYEWGRRTLLGYLRFIGCTGFEKGVLRFKTERQSWRFGVQNIVVCNRFGSFVGCQCVSKNTLTDFFFPAAKRRSERNLGTGQFPQCRSHFGDVEQQKQTKNQLNVRVVICECRSTRWTLTLSLKGNSNLGQLWPTVLR